MLIQAEADAERAGALYDQLATAALSGSGGCSSSGNDGSSGDGGVGGGGAAQERRRLLLQRAQEAQQVRGVSSGDDVDACVCICLCMCVYGGVLLLPTCHTSMLSF